MTKKIHTFTKVHNGEKVEIPISLDVERGNFYARFEGVDYKDAKLADLKEKLSEAITSRQTEWVRIIEVSCSSPPVGRIERLSVNLSVKVLDRTKGRTASGNYYAQEVTMPKDWGDESGYHVRENVYNHRYYEDDDTIVLPFSIETMKGLWQLQLHIQFLQELLYSLFGKEEQVSIVNLGRLTEKVRMKIDEKIMGSFNPQFQLPVVKTTSVK